MSPLERALSYDPQGFAKDRDGPGLQPPMIDPILMATMAGSPALFKALGELGRSAPRMLAQEAGAIFPEGSIPAEKALVKELGDMLPDTQANYLRNLKLADWHAEKQDWPRVLADKWAMLKHAGGN